MANVFGPKLGLLFNANIGEYYADNFRKFLQALDQLIMGNVINSTTVVPPASPSAGDSYLILSTPSGAWSTFAVNSLAVWDTQVTNSGTNTQVPAWVNYTPKSGWIIWNIALASLYCFNGTTWNPLQGGANFPTNTDITSMTGIPGTAIDSTGYLYSTGTYPVKVGASTIQIGSTVGTGFKAIELGIDVGTGLGGTIAMSDTGGGTTISADGMTSSGSIECGGGLIVGNGSVLHNGMACDGVINITPGTPFTFTPDGITGQSMVLINSSNTSTVALLGFANYPTQTTVGTAGAASALPATPSIYLQMSVNGTVYVFPGYKQS